MRKIIRENINAAFSLHDMNVIAFDVSGNDIVMRTQSGMVETTPPYRQLDGFVEFHNVQWEFSYVYLLSVDGNTGKFQGEKMFFRDFLEKYKSFGFSIMDENYGYNRTQYTGFLLSNHQFCECMIEIYHEGDMIFVADE